LNEEIVFIAVIMNKIGPSQANSSGRLTLHWNIGNSPPLIATQKFLPETSAEDRTFLECRSQQSPNMTDNRTHSEVAGGLTLRHADLWSKTGLHKETATNR